MDGRRKYLFFFTFLVGILLSACGKEPDPFSKEELLKARKFMSQELPYPLWLNREKTFSIKMARSSNIKINEASFSPNGQFLIAFWRNSYLPKDSDGFIVWNLETGQEIFKTAVDSPVKSYYFIGEDQLFLLSDSIEIINLKTFKRQKMPAAYISGIEEYSVNKDRNLLAILDKNQQLSVWDLVSGKLIYEQKIADLLEGFPPEENSREYKDKITSFYKNRGLPDESIKSLERINRKPLIHKLELLPNSEEVMLTGLLGTSTHFMAIANFSTKKFKVFRVGELLTLTAKRFIYSPDNKTIATASGCTLSEGRSGVIFIDKETGQISKTERYDCYGNLVFSPDSKFLAATDDDEITLWDVQTRQLVRSFPNKDSYQNLKFSPDGTKLTALIKAQQIEELDISSGESRILDNNETINPDPNFKPNRVNVEFTIYPPGRDSRVYGNCLLIINAETQLEVLQICAFTESDGLSWVALSPRYRFDASSNGYQRVEPLYTDLELFQFDFLKRKYHEPGLISKVLWNGDFNRAPKSYIAQFSEKHLNGNHGTFWNIVLNALFLILLVVLLFGSAFIFVEILFQPALIALVYYVPLCLRLRQLKLLDTIYPLLKYAFLMIGGFSGCALIIAFIIYIVAHPLAVMMFSVFVTVQNFYGRHRLFFLSRDEQSAVVNSLKPYFTNDEKGIKYTKLLLQPHYLQRTDFFNIFVLLGLTIFKLVTFWLFIYSILIPENSSFRGFGIAAVLLFYKMSNSESNKFFLTTNAHLINQSFFSSLKDLLIRILRVFWYLYLFFSNRYKKKLAGLIFTSFIYISIRIVDLSILSLFVFLLFYFPIRYLWGNHL